MIIYLNFNYMEVLIYYRKHKICGGVFNKNKFKKNTYSDCI